MTSPFFIENPFFWISGVTAYGITSLWVVLLIKKKIPEVSEFQNFLAWVTLLSFVYFIAPMAAVGFFYTSNDYAKDTKVIKAFAKKHNI